MELQIVALGKFSAPRVVNDHRCADLRSLHNRLNFAAILGALPISFREKEIDCALLVVLATLEESVCVEENLQSVFCCPTLEEFLPDGFRHEHD